MADNDGNDESVADITHDINEMKADLIREARDQMRAQRSERRTRDRNRDRGSRSKDNVVACRLDNDALEAVDTLVEAGVRSTRADAAAWLIGVGLEAHRELLDDLTQTVAEIRRLRQDAASKAQRFAEPTTDSDAAGASDPGPDDHPTERLPRQE